jgi:hypothetical protein
MGDEPYGTWHYLFLEIKRRFPRLSHVSVTEPRDTYLRRGDGENVNASMKFSSDRLRAIIRGIPHESISELGSAMMRFPDPSLEHPTVFMSAGGYRSEDAEDCAERTGDVIGYGRFSIANPE